jgi:hypothetical protein
MPPDPLSAMSQPSMFGAPGPRFTGPVNINVQGNFGAAMMQMALPMLMQGMMNKGGMAPGQFLPTQNMYDQFVAQQHFMGQQRAMSTAARRDMAFVEDFLGGTTKLMTGRDPTAEERQRNFYLARQVSNMTPMMVNLLGPDIVDQLHGRRGSATVFAQRFHSAMRTGLDPVTGQIGMSGDSAGLLTNDIYERLYGRGANPAQMRGIRAGQAGLLAEEMQLRGMLVAPSGAMSLNERLAALLRTLDSGEVQRLAERAPEIRDRLARGEAIPDSLMNDAREKVKRTHSQLRGASDAGREMTAAEIEAMPAGEDILRLGDAQRISSRLKDLSGVVSAMRDIFGDMGHPNAPMREIINGLEALTQGGLASMSPAELERMVRMTQSLSRQSGVGIQGMLGLTAQAAGLADQLGLNRTLAVQATQGAVGFAAAAGDTQGLHIPAYGSLTKEQLLLVDQQLRMTAAASPAVNQINAMLRMADEGVLAPAAGSELAAMLDAARSGTSTYQFNGATKSLLMNRTVLKDIMTRDGGISSQTADTFIFDKYGNQEYGIRYNTIDAGREMQRIEAVRLAQSSFADRAMIEGGSEEDIAELTRLGLITGRDDLANLTNEIGREMGKELFNLKPEVLRNTGARNAALGGVFESTLRKAIRARMPGATDEQVEAAFQAARARFGGENASNVMAGGGIATFDTRVRNDSNFSAYQSWMGVAQTHNATTHAAAQERRREAQAAAAMSSALSGLNSAGPIERIMDAVAEATPDTTTAELLSRFMGGVDIEKIAEADPVVAAVRDAMERARGAERVGGKLTAGGVAAVEDEGRLITALRVGGAAARTELERRRKAGTLTPELEQALISASTDATDTAGGGFDIRAIRHGAVIGASVTKAHVKATAAAGEDAEQKLDAVDKAAEGDKAAAREAASESLSAFLANSKTRADALLNDDVNMQQLGAGGMDLLQSLRTDERRLQEMADKESERLGRPVTVADLLTDKDVDSEVGAQARLALKSMRGTWSEIQKRREYNEMPGLGVNRENLARAAVTDREKAAIAEEREFRNRYMDGPDGTAEAQRADEVVGELLALQGGAAADFAGIDINKQKLLDVLVKGTRSIDVHRAVDAQERLTAIAVEKGFLTEDTAKSPEERRKAFEAMYAAKAGEQGLTDADVADIARFREDREALGDIGLRQMDEKEFMDETLGRLDSFTGALAQPPAAIAEPVHVTMDGTFREIDDNSIHVTASGVTDPTHTPLGTAGPRHGPMPVM